MKTMQRQRMDRIYLEGEGEKDVCHILFKLLSSEFAFPGRHFLLIVCLLNVQSAAV